MQNSQRTSDGIIRGVLLSAQGTLSCIWRSIALPSPLPFSAAARAPDGFAARKRRTGNQMNGNRACTGGQHVTHRIG